MVSGFSVLFYHGADVLIRFSLVFRLSTSFTLSNVRLQNSRIFSRAQATVHIQTKGMESRISHARIAPSENVEQRLFCSLPQCRFKNTFCTSLCIRFLSTFLLGLKTWPNIFLWLFSRFKIRLIRFDTPLTYGIDTYAFGLSQGFSCGLFGWSDRLFEVFRAATSIEVVDNTSLLALSLCSCQWNVFSTVHQGTNNRSFVFRWAV